MQKEEAKGARMPASPPLQGVRSSSEAAQGGLRRGGPSGRAGARVHGSLCSRHPLTSQGWARAGHKALSRAFEGEPGGPVRLGGRVLIGWLPPGSPRVDLFL